MKKLLPIFVFLASVLCPPTSAPAATAKVQVDTKTHALSIEDGSTVIDAKNITLTVGGMTVSDASGVKTINLGGGAPIVRPSATTDLRVALINLGLYTTGGASPLNLNGGTLTAGPLSATSGTFTTMLIPPGSTVAGLGAAGTPGRIKRLTDGPAVGALVIDDGTNWVAPDQQSRKEFTVTMPPFNAKADGITDDTAAFNAACVAAAANGGRGTVIVPNASYLLNGQVDIPAFVRLRGDAMTASKILINNTATPATATFVMATSSEMHGIIAIFTGATSATKPFIKVSGRGVGLSDLWIDGAYDALDFTILDSANLSHLDRVNILNLLHYGIHIGTARDNFYIDSLVLRMTNGGVGILSDGQADGVYIKNSILANDGATDGPAVRTTTSNPYIGFVNTWFDGEAYLDVAAGRVDVTGGQINSSATVTGGHLKINSGTVVALFGTGISSAPKILVNGGVLSVDAADFIYTSNGTLDGNAVLVQSGTASVRNSYFERGTTGTQTFTRACLGALGGAITVTNNRVSSLTGTGLFIYREGSTALDSIAGNVTPGWSNTIPAGATFSVQGTITDSVPFHADVYRSTDQAISTATVTPLAFDTEIFDNDGLHSTSVNTDRITIVHAGVYRVTGYMEYAQNGTGSRAASFRLNGTASVIVGDTRVPVSDNNSAITIGFEHYFAAGDYILLCAYQTSGGSLNVNAGGASVKITRLN